MKHFGSNRFKTLEERLEEIRLHLLDNDLNKLGDLIPLTSADSKFVHIRRRVGTEREHIAVYERIPQLRFRVMTDSERVHFDKLLDHRMTEVIKYDGGELPKVKSYRNPKALGLGYLLSMLKGDGNVISATIYKMPYPFDINPALVVTRRRFVESRFARGYFAVRKYFYVRDEVPAYVRVDKLDRKGSS